MFVTLAHTLHPLSASLAEDDSHLPKDKIALLRDIIKSPFFLSVKEVSYGGLHWCPVFTEHCSYICGLFPLQTLIAPSHFKLLCIPIPM